MSALPQELASNIRYAITAVGNVAKTEVYIRNTAQQSSVDDGSCIGTHWKCQPLFQVSTHCYSIMTE